MATTAARARGNGGRARLALRERLEGRREEIEAAALTRVRAISGSAEVSDPAYAEGLRVAVAAAVDYGIETTGREHGDSPIPVALLAQARMAARVGIPLDTVLRRYFAGYSLLGYYILEEAAHAGLTDGAELKRLLGVHAGLFDRLLAAVGEEYARETEIVAHAGGERRKAERIERLLAGELVDTSEIPYDFSAWHVGVVAGATEVQPAIRELAVSQDCQLLLLPRDDGALWAWLGSRRRLAPVGLCEALAHDLSTDHVCTLGEPAEGLAGWRFTHHQAVGALPMAARGDGSAVRYADVALLASLANDDLLTTSLSRLYLEPLVDERGGSVALLETLRAYFTAENNVSSAAAALGVSRQTVNRHLQAAERRLDRPLSDCSLELELALRLRSAGLGSGPDL